jgi:glycine betaine/proline transport system ATP-binding protein
LTPQPMPKLRIESLVKIYGDNPDAALRMLREGADRDEILKTTGQMLAIADVSLDVSSHEIVIIVGLSGSGKSTLLRCINRLIEPSDGRIYIDGEDIVRADKERLRQIRLTKVSMVFQHFGLFPHKSVIENVEFGLKLQGLSKEHRRKKAMEALEIVGLPQWAKHLPSSLSGGMQQRVGLARALATGAEIMLMDEAFSALDPLTRQEVQDELLRIQKELHKTIIFISHDLREAVKLGNRIAVMRDGQVVQLSTPEELLTQPRDDYVRAFVDSQALRPVGQP